MGFGIGLPIKRALTSQSMRVSAVLWLIVFAGCNGLMNGIRKDSEDSRSEVEEEGFRLNSSPALEGAGERRSDAEDSKDKRELSRSSEWTSRSSPGDAARVPDGDSWVTTANTPVFLPKNSRQYKNRSHATREDFIDQSQDEGSLWASGGQTNYFFTKNRVRSPGDLVTLTLDEALYSELLLEAKRTLNFPEREVELNLAQETLRNKFIAEKLGQKKDQILTSAAAPESAVPMSENASGAPSSSPSPSPSRAPGEGIAKGATAETMKELGKLAPRAHFNDVDLSRSLDLKVGDSMMGEILERFPNGNYKIRAVKKVQYKNGMPRLVSVIGIVKSSDIAEDGDSVHSGRLYEYRVEVAH